MKLFLISIGVFLVLVAAPCEAFFRLFQQAPGVSGGPSVPMGGEKGESRQQRRSLPQRPLPNGVFAGGHSKELALQAQEHLKQLEQQALSAVGTALEDCWKKGVSQLRHKCEKALASQAERAKMALHFTHCRLQFDERDEAEYLSFCMDQQRDKEQFETTACTKKLSSDTYTVYSQLLNHVDVICYHLQEELFQARTEDTVELLVDASSKAHQSLADVQKRAGRLTESMDQVQSKQEPLMSGMEKLVLATDKQLAIQAIQELRSDELRSVLDRLLSVQQRIFQENTVFAEALSKNITTQLLALEGVGDSTSIISRDVGLALKESQLLTEGQQKAIGGLQKLQGDLSDVTKQHDESIEKANRVLELLQTLQSFTDGPLLTHLQSIENASGAAQELALSVQAQQMALRTSTSHILDSLEQVKVLQARVSGTFTTVETIVIYLGALFAVLLLTVAERLKNGRFVALMVLTVGAGLEYFLMRNHPSFLQSLGRTFGGNGGGGAVPPLDGELLGVDVVLLDQGVYAYRRALFGVIVFLLSHVAYKYKSPQQLEREIIREELTRVFKDPQMAQCLSAAVGLWSTSNGKTANIDVKKPSPSSSSSPKLLRSSAEEKESSKDREERDDSNGAGEEEGGETEAKPTRSAKRRTASVPKRGPKA